MVQWMGPLLALALGAPENEEIFVQANPGQGQPAPKAKPSPEVPPPAARPGILTPRVAKPAEVSRAATPLPVRSAPPNAAPGYVEVQMADDLATPFAPPPDATPSSMALPTKPRETNGSPSRGGAIVVGKPVADGTPADCPTCEKRVMPRVGPAATAARNAPLPSSGPPVGTPAATDIHGRVLPTRAAVPTHHAELPYETRPTWQPAPGAPPAPARRGFLAWMFRGPTTPSPAPMVVEGVVQDVGRPSNLRPISHPGQAGQPSVPMYAARPQTAPAVAPTPVYSVAPSYLETSVAPRYGMVPAQPPLPGREPVRPEVVAAKPKPTVEATAPISPYAAGRASDYRWLQGTAEYEAETSTWHIRYSSAKSADPYGGKVALAADPRLSRLRDGDIIRVEGRLSRTVNGPAYQFQRLLMADPATK